MEFVSGYKTTMALRVIAAAKKRLHHNVLAVALGKESWTMSALAPIASCEPIFGFDVPCQLRYVDEPEFWISAGPDDPLSQL